MAKLEYQALKAKGLSEKALNVYKNSDPCEVFETEEGLSIKGIIERDFMTIDELNEILESLAEEE